MQICLFPYCRLGTTNYIYIRSPVTEGIHGMKDFNLLIAPPEI